MASVSRFDASRHSPGTRSHEALCGQGGKDTCSKVPAFSVNGDEVRYNVAACDDHLAGAVRQALGMDRKS